MLRSSGLGARRRMKRRDAINPMESIANLADVMLVFACGLMIAIIMFWKVDINHVVDVVPKEELMEVKNLEQVIKDGGLSNALESKGVAYEDPETGKMYIIMP